MCGIVASLRFGSGAAVSEAELIVMRDTMVHRGPDSAGVWRAADRSIGLAHRRLAIVDRTARADQPMATPDRRLHLVFNGEIYNHVALRAELVGVGVDDWRTTHSDTEVLLYAIRHWGVLGCLRRLRGMFAFAVWDAANGRLTCVRDRIGVKPLYYARLRDRVNVASEIKALLVDPQQPREVDESGLFDYLTYMTVPAPRTMFRDVAKLPGGCWLSVERDGRTTSGRWWDAWDEVDAAWIDPAADAAQTIFAHLDDAVAARAEADVPVGVFLSGGIDSTTNLELFMRHQQGAVKTFTIGYADDGLDFSNEVEHAARAARRVGAEHTSLMLAGSDVERFLARMVHLQDEPIGDPVCVPLYYVAELARSNGVVVAQVGEGADELFFGYPRWHQVLQLTRWVERFPRLAPPLLRGGLGLLGRGDGYLAGLLARAGGEGPSFLSGAECFTDRGKHAVLGPGLRARFAQRSPAAAIDDIWQRYLAHAPRRDVRDWMTYVDLNLRLPELLLMRVDKMSMGTSVEARVPFLDPTLIGAAMALPPDVRAPLGRPKALLKDAVRRLVPAEVLARPKQGFGLPMTHFVFGPLREVLRAEIADLQATTDYFDAAGIAALWQRRDANGLWWLFNFAAWHRHFVRAARGTGAAA